MIDPAMKTPSFVAVGLAVLALAACGSPDAQAPAAGESAMSALEPIDAVPLPLDDNPLSPPPVATPAKKADEKTDATDPAAETPEATEAAAATAAADPTVKPPRIVVAPREPASPASPKPTPTPAPTEPEKPVLNF
ncbi:hypothetical protein BH09PSE1_BH09PSE1_19680 [soil metagenome]